MREMLLAHLTKWLFLINSRNEGTFGIDLFTFTVNTLNTFGFDKCFSVINFFIKTLTYPLKYHFHSMSYV